MNPKTINPVNKLSGEIIIPGDKSISHRAVMAGAIAQGKTVIKNLLDCDDCNYTIRAFQEMGITVERIGSSVSISGKGLKGLTKPKGPINVGNSGTSMRLLAGILAGQDFSVTLEGDAGLTHRPMKRIIEPLSLMGVNIKGRNNEFPPIEIAGGNVKPIDYKLPIQSAQIKSAVLFAGLYADGTTTVRELYKSRDHTERMLSYFGSKLKVDNLKISLEGKIELEAKPVNIPGDISSASFFMAGAVLLNGSRVKMENVGINPTRAGILNVLSRMGAKVIISNRQNLLEPTADIEIESAPIKGIVIEESEIPSLIDELPIIFVLASLAKGRTVIKGAEELRVKETDRINSMKYNLEKMGAGIDIGTDEIMIEGVKALNGANLKSFGDHRTCMSMAIAALTAKGESAIDDVECVNKSFPGFFGQLKKLKG